ncbi:MAG: hypothetical protein HY391_03585, partial [Deltaproteobacteria bacterium]|nr:hypothetical protein [Deltaproteobacteria bacterium]
AKKGEWTSEKIEAEIFAHRALVARQVDFILKSAEGLTYSDLEEFEREYALFESNPWREEMLSELYHLRKNVRYALEKFVEMQRERELVVWWNTLSQKLILEHDLREAIAQLRDISRVIRELSKRRWDGDPKVMRSSIRELARRLVMIWRRCGKDYFSFQRLE